MVKLRHGLTEEKRKSPPTYSDELLSDVGKYGDLHLHLNKFVLQSGIPEQMTEKLYL